MRKCGFEEGPYFGDFRFQFMAPQGVMPEIIKECPRSHVDEAIPWLAEYQRRRSLVKLGVTVSERDLTLLEVDAFAYIDQEITDAEIEKIRLETKKKPGK